MKKYIIVIITILILGSGVYIFSQKNGVTPRGHTMEETNGKPIAQSHRSYELEAVSKPNPNKIELNKPTTIKYKIKNDKGEILKDFEIAHESIMHFIVIRKDLTQFDHLHPTLNKETGEFNIDVVFTVDGPYRFFADFTPGLDNPQTLPVTLNNDITVGDVSSFQPHSVIVDTQNKKIVPPDYEVTYLFPQTMHAQSEFKYSLDVFRNGKPVTNLENYLGALGHSIILKDGSLDYIHTHPEEAMSSGEHSMKENITPASTGPKIEFSTSVPETGMYRIFTQFKHQGKILSTEYTIEVK